ncbi:hypothetical protein [Sulfurimonas sp.]|uniref:hypothetical protein n=1 Tax=Sulfurimonas sp. TaxID=2022749 RepID=UPI003D102A51
MAWVAVEKDGIEYKCNFKPERIKRKKLHFVFLIPDGYSIGDVCELKAGTIEKLIGKKLTWEDEPVEIKERQNDGKFTRNEKEV